jgi:hypothetical protein
VSADTRELEERICWLEAEIEQARGEREKARNKAKEAGKMIAASHRLLASALDHQHNLPPPLVENIKKYLRGG